MTTASPLSALVEAATSASAPVDELLRRLKVIAARSGLGELDEWVQHELDGYPDGNDMPAYRGPFAVAVLGDLSGPFGQFIKNAPIPPTAFPAEMREGSLWQVWFTQGVGQLEEWSRGTGALQFAWPPDMITYTRYLQERGECHIDPMLALMQVTQVMDRSTITNLLRVVRDRVLSLALRLERESPQVGEPDGPQVGPSVGRDVSIIINGGTATVAVASSNVTQTASADDFNVGQVDEIIRGLEDTGVVREEDLAELREALLQDTAEGTGTLGPKTQGWLKRWSGKAVGAAGTAAVGAVTKIILEQGMGAV